MKINKKTSISYFNSDIPEINIIPTPSAQNIPPHDLNIEENQSPSFEKKISKPKKIIKNTEIKHLSLLNLSFDKKKMCGPRISLEKLDFDPNTPIKPKSRQSKHIKVDPPKQRKTEREEKDNEDRFFLLLKDQKDMIIERTKVQKSWLVHKNVYDYKIFLNNALYISDLNFKAYKARSIRNYEVNEQINEEIQHLVSKKIWPIKGMEDSMRKSKKKKTFLLNYQENKKYWMQKPGKHFGMITYRKICFSICNKETDERNNQISFIQLTNQENQEKFKEFGLPDEIYFDNRKKKQKKLSSIIKWDESRLKEFDYRIIFKMNERKQPLAIYFTDFEEAKTIYNYLLFKKLINGNLHLTFVFKKIYINFINLHSQKFFQSIQNYIDLKEEYFDSSINSSDSDDSSEVDIERKKSESKLRKCELLFFFYQECKKEIIKKFIQKWLECAKERQEFLLNDAGLKLLEPHKLSFHIRKKKKEIAIEKINKNIFLQNYNKVIINNFILIWYNNYYSNYKEKFINKIINKRIIILDSIEIPEEYCYFKPKINLKISNIEEKNINFKNKFFAINDKKIVLNSADYKNVALEPIFKNKIKVKNLVYLYFEFEPIEIILENFESHDVLKIELYDEYGLSIFNENAQKIINNSENLNKIDDFDFSNFYNNLKQVTHSMTLRTKNFRVIFPQTFIYNLNLVKNENNIIENEIFIKFKVLSFEENLRKIYFNKKIIDSVFGITIENQIFSPKIIKKLKLFDFLSFFNVFKTNPNYFDEKIDNYLILKLNRTIIEKINDLTNKNYLSQSLQFCHNFNYLAPNFFENNFYNSKLIFLKILNETFSTNDQISLIKKGLPNNFRRLFWGFPIRKKIFDITLASYKDFLTQINKIEKFPSPFNEENLYQLLKEKEIELYNLNQINYLCFLQELNDDLINLKNISLRDKNRRKDNFYSITNIMKTIFFWSFISEKPMAYSKYLLQIIINIYLCFKSNYNYFYSEKLNSNCLEFLINQRPNNFNANQFLKQFDFSSQNLENDVFWTSIIFLNGPLSKLYFLEPPSNEILSSNIFFNSDLRGIKLMIFILKLYMKEKINYLFELLFFSDGIISWDSIIFEAFVTLFSSLNLRIDIIFIIWDLLIFKIEEKNEKKHQFIDNDFCFLIAVFIVLAKRVWNYIQIIFKSKKIIKKSNEFYTYFNIYAKLFEDIEIFIEEIEKEKQEIELFIYYKSDLFEIFDQELKAKYTYSNKFNKINFEILENNKFNFDFFELKTNKIEKNELFTDNKFYIHIFIHEMSYIEFFFENNEFDLEIIYDGHIMKKTKFIPTSKILLQIHENFIYNPEIQLIKINIYLNYETNNTPIKICNIYLNNLIEGFIYKTNYKLISYNNENIYIDNDLFVSLLIDTNKNYNFIEKSENEYIIYNNVINNFKNNSEISNYKNLNFSSIENIKEENNYSISFFEPINYIFNGYIYKELDEIKNIFKQFKIFNEFVDFQKLLKFNQNIKKENKQSSKINIIELFVSMILLSKGIFKEKCIILHNIFINLFGKINIIIFKSIINAIYEIIGVFINKNQIENALELNLNFNEININNDCLIRKGHIIIKESKKTSINLNITDILIDFILKKQILFFSKDIILGGCNDLKGLLEIIKNYIENKDLAKYDENLKLLLNLENIKNIDSMIIYVQIFYSNKKSNFSYFAQINKKWQIIENLNEDIPETNMDPDHPINSSKPKNKSFYNHKNIIPLTNMDYSIDLDKFLKVLEKMPFIKYYFSSNILNDIFSLNISNSIPALSNMIKENFISLKIYMNSEFITDTNINFAIKNKIFNLRKNFISYNLLLLNSQSIINTYNDNNDNIINYDINIKTFCFFFPIIILILKIKKKLLDCYIKNLKFKDIKKLIDCEFISFKIFDKEIDVYNNSFFNIFFDCKNYKIQTFKIEFKAKPDNTYQLIKNKNYLNINNKMTKILYLHKFSDYSTEWKIGYLLNNNFKKNEFEEKKIFKIINQDGNVFLKNKQEITYLNFLN